MRCPTFTFKNKKTGDTVVINQSDYNNERYQYLTNLGSLNDWERVSETSGDKGGFEASKMGGDIAIGVKKKRAKDHLGIKVKFAR